MERFDHFLFCYHGNKYREIKKHYSTAFAYNESEFNDNDIIVEPFGGIFGFSRVMYERGFRGHFIINDIDTTLINEYKLMQKDLDKYMEDIKDKFEKWKSLSTDGIYAKYDKDTPLSIKLMTMFRCANNGSIKKGTTKINNFEKKKEQYIDFFKHCTFTNYEVGELIDNEIMKQDKKYIIYNDPPYFDSNNIEYDKYLIDNKDRKINYIDGTLMYVHIMKMIENRKDNNVLVISMNYLSFFDYIINKISVPRHIIECKGKYQRTKNIKKHYIYIFS